MTQGPSLPSVFVSAVSGELKDARQLVANCLRVFHNIEVRHQDQIRHESGDLLVKLKTAIDESVGILQLIGEAYGAAPPGGIPEFGGEISFTRTEFLYALERRKKSRRWGHGSSRSRARARGTSTRPNSSRAKDRVRVTRTRACSRRIALA